jgi:hypothetical protein
MEPQRETLARPKEWKINTGFGTWNVRSHCRSQSMKAAREIAEYKLYLMGIQEVIWCKRDIEPGDVLYTLLLKCGCLSF